MSLVIAKKLSESIVFLSDTQQFNLLAELKENALNPQNKITIVDKQIAIGFAGIIIHAQNALEEIAKLDSKDLTNIVNVLLKHAKISNNETDFIVACYTSFKLIEIKNSIEQEVESSWVGNYAGFNLYQASFVGKELAQEHAPDVAILSAIRCLDSKKDMDHLLRMIHAFNIVINSNSKDVADIGGFNIVAYAEKSIAGFKFQTSLLKVSKILKESDFPTESGEWQPVPFGSEVDGAYAISIFPCSSHTGESVAIYFEVGQIGLYWRGSSFQERFKSTDKFLPELIDEIKETLDMVCSAGSTWEGYFKSGLKHLKDDTQKALRYYEQAIRVYLETSEPSNKDKFWLLYESRGLYYLESGKWKEALSDFNRGLMYSEDNSSLLNNIGVVYDQRSDNHSALEYFCKSYDLNKDPNVLDNINLMKKKLKID